MGCREFWSNCLVGLVQQPLGTLSLMSPPPFPQCRHVYSLNASDRCDFILANPDCHSDGGYLDYLKGIFCYFAPSLLLLTVTLYVRPRPGAGERATWPHRDSPVPSPSPPGPVAAVPVSGSGSHRSQVVSWALGLGALGPAARSLWESSPPAFFPPQLLPQLVSHRHHPQAVPQRGSILQLGALPVGGSGPARTLLDMLPMVSPSWPLGMAPPTSSAQWWLSRTRAQPAWPSGLCSVHVAQRGQGGCRGLGVWGCGVQRCRGAGC